MSNYHNRIMNIQSKESEYEYVGCQEYSYREGHRDARHAAAEIAIEAEREIEDLQQRNVKLYDELGEAYKKIMVLENDLNEFYDSMPPI